MGGGELKNVCCNFQVKRVGPHPMPRLRQRLLVSQKKRGKTPLTHIAGITAAGLDPVCGIIIHEQGAQHIRVTSHHCTRHGRCLDGVLRWTPLEDHPIQNPMVDKAQFTRIVGNLRTFFGKQVRYLRKRDLFSTNTFD